MRRAALEVDRLADGTVVAVHNLTPNPTEGCLTAVEWRLYAGDDEVWSSGAWAPAIPADVSADRVSLQAFGPGGTTTVTDDGAEGGAEGGCGC
ncbi:MAG: hypothetical protein ABMB14_41070, partial [Myxococcota bacterium]